LDLIATASGEASPSARYLCLNRGRPVLLGRIHGIPPSLHREDLFPASRNTEKAMFWMRQVRIEVADVKEADG
jgi:hypothetical protein